MKAVDEFFDAVATSINQMSLEQSLDDIAAKYHSANLAAIDSRIAEEGVAFKSHGIDPCSAEAGQILVARALRNISR